MIRSAITVYSCLVFLFFTGVFSSPYLWASDWQMSVTVSVPDSNADGGRLINRLEAGSLLTATDEYDNATDVLALLSGPVQAAFSHENESGYPGYLQLLWRDIRAAGFPKSWRIKVVSQQSSAPVTLEWTPAPSIGSDACHQGGVSLQDQTTGQLIDLNTGSRYSFASTGSSGSPEVRFFTLTVSSVPQNGPAMPTGLRSRSQRTGVQLQWTANPESNLAGYHVWRSLVNGRGYVRQTSAPTLSLKYADKQVTLEMTYYYVVTAVGANGCESGFSQQTVAIAK